MFEDRLAPALAGQADEKDLDAAIAFYESGTGTRASAWGKALQPVPDGRWEDVSLAVFKAAMQTFPEMEAIWEARGAENAAIGSLKKLVTAQEQFKATVGHGAYTTLAGLGASQIDLGHIESDLASGKRLDYTFTLTVGTPAGSNYCVSARPVAPVAGQRSFFVDSTGVIRFKVGAEASSADSPIE